MNETLAELLNLNIFNNHLFFLFFKFIDPPTVKIETSQMDNLEDEKDSVTLRCIVDSNPRAAILWKKEGLNGEFSPEQEIVFSPVTRHTAGQYSCTAENQLGMSKADYVEVDVKCKFSNFFSFLLSRDVTSSPQRTLKDFMERTFGKWKLCCIMLA